LPEARLLFATLMRTLIILAIAALIGISPALADTLTCSTFAGVRTCSSPDGYLSHESTWNGITTGDDNQGDHMAQRPALSASNACTSAGDGGTIGPRIRISRPGDGSARCNVSRAPALRRNSSQPTPPLQHLQRPTPSHINSNAPRRQARGARSSRPHEVPRTDPASRRRFDNVTTPKLPSLRDTQSVRVRPYSGSMGWPWEPDRIEPEVGPEQFKFADVRDVAAGYSNSMISIPVPKPGHLTLR
jgi:hypothetical protein